MDINNLWSGYDLNSKKQNSRCLAVNTILEGKYLVGPVLGQGGFGITYVGYDLNMEAKIAIKEYFPVELVSRDTPTMHGDRVLSLSGEKSVTYKAGLKKYVAEAQNVSQFSEIPGVVSVKDFFYANETAYIVMEYIDGISLKDYLKEKGGRLTEEETLAIMKPVLEALVQVHKSGIIHRDISPDNIMLTFEGSGHNKIQSVKLIDFGAARMTAKNDQKSLTIILKHGYAPEEQYRTHGEQGPWTDVYALCAVLYRMLTGETPVPAMDRMFKDELKSFDKFNTKVSANTAAAILKGLAVKKDERIQSVQELIGALYEGTKVKAGTAVGNRNKKTVLAAGIAAALIACVASGSLLSGKENPDLATEVASGIQQESTVAVQTSQASKEETEGNVAVENVAVDDQEEEAIGEAIVLPTRQTDLAAGEEHILRRKEDGTVEAFGSNESGQLLVQDWTHIAAVAAGRGFSAGLREDGVVLVAGELETKDEVELWTDIVEISSYDDVLFGLKQDGTIVSSGLHGESGDYYEWENIRAIASCNHALVALTEDGRVLISSTYEPDGEIASGEAEISGWEDVEHLICAQYAVFGLTSEGKVKCATLYDQVKDDHYNFDNMDSFEGVVQLFSKAGLTQFGVKADGSLCVGGFIDSSEYMYSLMEMDGLQGFIGIAYDEVYLAVKEDGTAEKVIHNYGNSTPERMEQLAWVDIIPGKGLVGIKRDGTALTYGTYGGLFGIGQEINLKNVRAFNRGHYQGFCYLTTDGVLYDTNRDEPIKWRNVKQIDGYDERYCVALFEDGSVKLAYDEKKNIPDGLKAVDTWNGVTQIAASGPRDNNSVYGLRENGTVMVLDGLFEEVGTREFEKWSDIQSIYSGVDAVGAIKKDGTAIFSNTRFNDYGQKNVSAWTNLTQLALSEYHTVGLREDGTVVATGNNHSGQCEVEDWKDIVYISVGESCTLGISKEGRLLVAGEITW